MVKQGAACWGINVAQPFTVEDVKPLLKEVQEWYHMSEQDFWGTCVLMALLYDVADFTYCEPGPKLETFELKNACQQTAYSIRSYFSVDCHLWNS